MAGVVYMATPVMYYSWCYFHDQSAIAWIIAVPTPCGSAAASLIYGHVGIYIGGGMVRHRLSGIVRSQSFWISAWCFVPKVGLAWR